MVQNGSTSHPMANSIDYESVHVKEGHLDGHEDEMHYTERRKYILERLREEGSPRRLDTKALAKTFDVSRKTIYDDFDALAEYIDDNLGAGESLAGDAIFGKATSDLLADAETLRAQGDVEAAARVTKEAVRIFKWGSEWRRNEDLDDLWEELEQIKSRLSIGEDEIQP